jgi:hypothetical protein
LIPVIQSHLPGLLCRSYTRLAIISGLMILLLILPPVVVASEGNPFEIQTASFSLDDTLLRLDLEINIEVPAFISIAISQGFSVPLMFEVEIYASRNYWVDKKIVTVKQSYLLHFQPMLSSYVVVDVNAGQRHYFDSLGEAIAYMDAVYDYPMLDVSNFDFNHEFYARTRFGIDREELPLPLKPSVFWPSDWDERSSWYSFELIPLNSGVNG